MRTAARIALVLTGTVIFFAATSVVSARADGRTDGSDISLADQTEASNLPRPQPAPRPEMLPDYAHAELFVALSKIARFFEFGEMPDVAGRKSRSILFASNMDVLRLQPKRHPVGKRGRVADVAIGEAEDKFFPQQQRQPAPVIIKFEGVVININVAGLEQVR